MKKLFIFLFLGIFFIGLVSAEICDTEISSIKQGNPINLTQVCDNCTQVNLTKVVYPNQSFALLGQYNMTQNGSNYYISYSQTKALGDYYYTSCGDLNGINNCQNTCFWVTPSGQSGSSNIVFFIFIIIAFYLINIIGFYMRNEWLTILGGMALLGLGVYIINNGIIVYRDWLSNYFAYVTISWGIISTLLALFSIYEEM